MQAPEEQNIHELFGSAVRSLLLLLTARREAGLGFLAAELLLAAPTFIEMLRQPGSALAPAMSASALTGICPRLLRPQLRVDAGARYVRQVALPRAADHIRRIQSEFRTPSSVRPCSAPRRRQPWGAVPFLCVLLLSGGGSASCLAAGPDLQAICFLWLIHPAVLRN